MTLLFQSSMLPLSRMVRLASLPTIQQASLPTLQQAQLLSTASGHKASVDSRWLSLFLSRSFLTLLIRHPIDSVTRGLPSFLSAKYWDPSPWLLFLLSCSPFWSCFTRLKIVTIISKLFPQAECRSPWYPVMELVLRSWTPPRRSWTGWAQRCTFVMLDFQIPNPIFFIVGWKLFSFCLWSWEETQFRKHPVCGHLWIATLHRLTLRRFTFLK